MSKTKKSVLAIDPASRSMGIAYRKKDGSLRYRTQKITDHKLAKRLSDIRHYMTALWLQLRFDVCVIEQSISVKNRKNANVVPNVSGVIMEFCGTHDIEVVEVPHTVAKKHITGKGRATKAEVQTSLEQMGYTGFDGFDASDALAVLLTYEESYDSV